VIAVLGGYKDPKHAEALQDIIQWERWTRDSLSEPYREMLEHWRLYLSKRKDHRKTWEKTWRALTLQPYPFLIVEGNAYAVSDILNSADPLVQAEGIGDEDVSIARKVERLMDLTLRMNQWRLRTENIVREFTIQGTAAIKVTWRHDVSKVSDSTPDSERAFESTRQAFADLGVDLPDDPDEYEKVRGQAQGDLQVELPQHPARMYKEVTTFRGPSFDRVSMFDLRFDPLVEKWSDQRRIIQRIVKTKKWVLDHTGEGAEFPFDPEQVKYSIDAGISDGNSQGGFNEWQLEVANMLGLGQVATGYPNRMGERELVEIFEVWDQDDDEAPYKVVLNRHGIINKDPGGSPYGHGECPVSLLRNIPVPGSALGMSSLKAPKSLFYELWTLRDLRVDAVTLATLPAMEKLNELGIPDATKALTPGGTVSVPRLGVLKKMDVGGPHPDIWREISEIKYEIDDVTVNANVRGTPATVGRVSASESERRFSNALTKIKAAAVRFEEEIHVPLRQAMYLWYQNGDDETLLRATSGDEIQRYGQSISREELSQALDMDFNFRGPSRIVNRDMLVQQLLQWFGTFGAMLKPSKQLSFARQTYEVMGLKNRNDVIPDQDIEMAMQAELMQMQAPVAQSGQPPAPEQPLEPEQPQPPQEAQVQPEGLPPQGA